MKAARTSFVGRLCLIALCTLFLAADADSALSDGASEAAIKPDAARYPIFSALFRGTENPFHLTVAQLISRGAQRQPAELASNLWAQGFHAEDTLNYPLYRGTADQVTYDVKCDFYGNCNEKSSAIHLPPGASQEAKSDHHISSVDIAQGFEFDGWGGAEAYGGGPCNVDTAVHCSWGGFYPFAQKGLSNNGTEGDHAGFAFGLFAVTAQELLQGHIEHALGIDAECLDDPPVYPADIKNKSDQTCSGGKGPQPAPSYGMMVHLRDTFDISNSAYSPPCKTILVALATYGAYLYDTGNHGLFVALESPQTYSPPNPWYVRIFPEMARYGDAQGGGSFWRYSSCLNRLDADDLEIYRVPSLGY